jgi:beta-galactosidase/beta-glucuronidase
MVRSSFTNLNGLWEFKAVEAGTSTNGAFGKTLNETILVPFPVESCLSGLRDVNDTNGVPPTYQHMWYRTTVSQDQIQGVAGGRTLLHFGAVDWQTDVYVNGLWVGSNTGGYNAFSFDITEVCLPLSHSLCLYLCLSVSVSLSLSHCLQASSASAHATTPVATPTPRTPGSGRPCGWRASQTRTSRVSRSMRT